MNEDFLHKLADAAAGDVLSAEPMSKHTTFRVGGPADAFVVPSSVESAARVVSLCHDEGVKLHVVGCGSNLLIADAGLRGVVMKIGAKLGEVTVWADGRVSAQAGATNAKVARAALAAGLSGFEFAAGIPGSIGGAAVMNAGAYGGELRDVATGVTCLDSAGKLRRLSAAEAGWTYRSSALMAEGLLVLSVDLQLTPGRVADIQERMDELAQRRAEKQPLDLPSAGSTFKRPEGHFAGKLIQDAGLQGYSVGGAQVSTKHAGFVVNVGGATAADVKQVIEDVRARVLALFGVELVPEVRIWGFD